MPNVIAHKIVESKVKPSTTMMNKKEVEVLDSSNLNLAAILKPKQRPTTALERPTPALQRPTPALQRPTQVLQIPTQALQRQILVSQEQGKKNFGLLFEKGIKLIEERVKEDKDNIVSRLIHTPRETTIVNLGDISKPIVINEMEYLIEKLFKNTTFQRVVQEKVDSLISNTEVIFNCRQIITGKYILRIKNKLV